MQLTLAGVHMDLSESLKAHTSTKLAELGGVVDEIVHAHASLTQDAHHSHLHAADITVQLSGLRLAANGQGIDHYAAVDEAVGKLKRQLERYKGRILRHRARHAAFKEQMKDLGPLAVEESVLDGVDEPAAEHDLIAQAASQYAAYVPTVTKKEVTRIAPMQVDDAVMQMDLLHQPAYLFLNADTGQLNMVFRDGANSVRWVAPKGV